MALMFCSISMANSDATLTHSDDLSLIAQQAREKQVPILIEFAARHCEYCQRLEEEQLQPMLLDAKTHENVLIVKHLVDKVGYIKDMHGKSVSYADFADTYNIDVTPTMILVDPNGRLLTRKIYGYNNPYFFSAYLDEAIQTARKKLLKNN